MIPHPSHLSLLVLLASSALTSARRRIALAWATLACAVGRGREAEPEPAERPCLCSLLLDDGEHEASCVHAPPVPPDDALPDGREPPWGEGQWGDPIGTGAWKGAAHAMRLAERVLPAVEEAVHDPAALDAGELALFPEPTRPCSPLHLASDLDPPGSVCGIAWRYTGNITYDRDAFARAGDARCCDCVAAMAGRSS